MTEEVLKVEHLTVEYLKDESEFKAVDNLSIALKEKEILCILGESGSGKSTLAKAMIGILSPSAKISGSMKFADFDYIEFESEKTDWSAIRGKKIGYIYQDAHQALNPLVKIQAQFRESIMFHKIVETMEEADEMARRLLGYFNFENVDRIMDSYPFELSGGMCQRVCIALILALKPEIIIADEITSALDVVNQMEIVKLLKRIRDDFGLSIIFITHDIGVAALVSDAIVVLNKGKVEERGVTEELLKSPKVDYTRSLLSARLEISSIADYRGVVKDNEDILLEVRNLDKTYKNNTHKTLSKINFDVKKGEIVGILGASGCGKTTLMKCIIGIEKFDSGQIFFNSQERKSVREKERRRNCKNIQLIFQNARSCLNPRRTTMELMKEPDRYLKLYKEPEKLARKYLAEVNLIPDQFFKKPPQLSTGQCQRVSIARALMVNPNLMICDEIISALDVNTQIQIIKLLLDIQREKEMAILMVSHDVHVLKNFCHRIIILDGGQVCQEIVTDDIDGENLHSYTKKLIETEKEIEENFKKMIGFTPS